jgi:tetratricopeptide (TPR) repeat protein
VLVFISYNTLDLNKAQALAATLAMRCPGNEWFLAPRNITGGAWWVPKLGDTMARADAVLFLAGNEIGPWQQLEYYEALRLSRERRGRPRLIPVVIAEQSPGLPFFAQLHQIVTADPAARETLDAIERALDDSLPPNAAPAWQRFQPYKGLPALDEADAAFFFGREKEIARILDLMAGQPDRVVALIGQSGVGKSSLAFAGILARLKSQLWPLQTGQWPAGLRDSRAFLPLVIRPGEKPLKELALAFAQLYTKKSFELDEEAAGWARRFVKGSGLHDMLRATHDQLAEALIAVPPKRFVIYLDQGEELYSRANLDEARRFSALMAEAARHEAFSVLLSLRSDYYAAWQNDRAVFDAAAQVDVLSLDREVLGDIVRKPALSLGARFESGDMVDRIADATAREPGALPLLSDLLHEMWLKMQARGDGVLRWADNPEIVDVAAPLRRRADAFLADPANDEAVIRRLFTLRLAHVPEAGEPVHRRAHRTESSAQEWAAAEKLASQDWRLLTIARAADGEPVVEVAHEQLLRRWPRLKSWLDDEREFLVWKGQAEYATAAHSALPETERDGAVLMGRSLAIARGWLERRGADLATETRDFVAASVAADTARRETELRQQRRVLIGTTIGLAVALILAGLAGWQWLVAETQTKQARFQRDRANHTVALATRTATSLIFDIMQKLGHPIVPAATIAGALDSALKLQGELAAGGNTSPEDQSNTEWQRDLSINDDNIGNDLKAMGHLDEALVAYRNGFAIRKRLAQNDPGNAGWQRELAINDDAIGDVLKAQAHLDDALAAYRDGLAIRRALTLGKPEWQRELVFSLRNVGVTELELRDPTKALESYSEQVSICRKMYKAARSPQNKSALVSALGSLADVQLLNQQPNNALSSAVEALSLDPAANWVETNRAHALLFLGRFDEAKYVYLTFRDTFVSRNKTFSEAVQDDFAEFRKYGIGREEMKQVEALLAERRTGGRKNP